MSFSDLHIYWAWVVVVGNAIAGGWALAAHWQEHLRSKALWVFTAAAQISITVQVIFGVAAMNVEGATTSDFHMFYGFIALASVGLIYAYREQVPWLYLLYGLGGFFLMGLGLRAIVIGWR